MQLDDLTHKGIIAALRTFCAAPSSLQCRPCAALCCLACVVAFQNLLQSTARFMRREARGSTHLWQKKCRRNATNATQLTQPRHTASTHTLDTASTQTSTLDTYGACSQPRHTLDTPLDTPSTHPRQSSTELDRARHLDSQGSVLVVFSSIFA